MTTENIDGVMRRIQKLLAIANDNRANPEEAAAAAGMAERIMAKYQIEHADVIEREIKSGKGMETADVIATAKTNGTKVDRVPTWASMVALAVSHLHDCGASTARAANGEACIRFFGYSADVQVAAWTLGYLVHTVNQLCVTFRDDPQYIALGRKAMHSYRLGVAFGIIRKIEESVSAKKQEQAVSATGTSLMVIKTDAVAERYGKSVVQAKKVKTTRSVGSAFTTGLAHGSRVEIAAGAIR